jgi:peptidoglycan hydrolase-like protein with peptidoglycan-binding domain
MSFSLIWMPFALRKAGLKVAPVNGWESRGRGEAGKTLGVLCHHTAGPRNGNMPSLGLLIAGRTDLRGPLAQLGLGRDGTYYVIAAGRCNHAGAGNWNGVTNGNAHFIGIEAENTGRPDDVWPAVQVDAYQRGVAALLMHAGLSAESCAGHKEYARPSGRKPDPTLDMTAFRASVAAFIAGTAPAPVLIPAEEPSPSPGAATGRPTLRRGAKGDAVKRLQQLLDIDADGDFGGKTEAAMRAFQRQRQLVPDGIVGPKTWAQLDDRREPSAPRRR